MQDDRTVYGVHPQNLVLAVIGCAIVSAMCAITVFVTCDFILDSFRNTDAMVMLITDSGLRSDDKTLERNLSSATSALRACRDVALAMGMGSGMVGLAMAFRIARGIRA
jgi:hypothetical protein